MRGSEENGINGISGKHPCGRAYRLAHFGKYLVVRKHLEKNSKRFVVTRNGGGPHPCGSAPKPFSLTPRQYLTRKWYVPIPKARHTSHSVPIRQVNAFLIFQCNTKVLYKPTCMSSPQDFSPTTISDRLTPTRLIPDHAPPPTGQNFRGCSVFFLRRQISRVARTDYEVHVRGYAYVSSLRGTKESNKAARLFPGTKPFPFSNTDAANYPSLSKIWSLFLSLHS